MKPKTIKIDEVEYVQKDSIQSKAESFEGMEYVIVRTYCAGVFAGYLEKKDGQSVTMRKARRLWYWSGAASLSQLAMEGVKKPDECKFPCEVDRVQLEQVIEILDCTEAAKESINSVSIWQQ